MNPTRWQTKYRVKLKPLFMKGLLARNTALTLAILGLRVATQATALLMLTRLLGAEVYGSIVSATSLAVVLGILPSMGTGYVMMASAPQRSDAVSHVWQYAWPLTLGLGFVLLIIYLPVAYVIGGEHSLPLSILLWLGVTELLLTPLATLSSHALQANNRVPLSQIVQWLPLGIRALAIFPCFFMTYGARLEGYVVLQLGAAATGLFVSLAIVNRHCRFNWTPRLISWNELRNGANYAGMHIIAANPSELDKIIAPRWISSYDIGVYAVTTRAINALAMPVVAMLLSTQPRLFSHAHHPTDHGGHLIKRIGILAGTWGCLSWLMLYVSSPIFPWLFGSSFLMMSQLMPLLAAVALPLCLRHSAGVILVALGKPTQRMSIELGGAVTLVLGMAALAPHGGIQGLGIALIISESSMAIAGWHMVYRNTR